MQKMNLQSSPDAKQPFKSPGQGGPPPAGWKPPMADISWVKRKFLDIPYAGESRAQCFDLYLPETGEGPFPLLIHIHGGGFALGDKRDDHMDAYLTGIRRGFAVASVEYRLSSEATFPAAVLDCRQAIRFIRAHAGEYKVDPARISVIGGSAGGNLAAMMGMNIPNGEFPGEETGRFSETPFVLAAVDQFGPMDFKRMDEQARENGVSFADHDQPFSPESKYLGITLPLAPQELNDSANPLTYAGKAMCPMLVQHGTADRLVPYQQSVEFVEGLRAKGLGDRVTFVPLEGADHEDKMFTTPENLDIVFRFLTEHL
jgi:acetyl esterase/lipase